MTTNHFVIIPTDIQSTLYNKIIREDLRFPLPNHRAPGSQPQELTDWKFATRNDIQYLLLFFFLRIFDSGDT